MKKQRTIIGGDKVAINKALRLKLLWLTWVPLATTLWNKFRAYDGKTWGWIDFFKDLHTPTELLNLALLAFSIMFAVSNTRKYINWRVGDIVKVAEPFTNTFKKKDKVYDAVIKEARDHIILVKERVLSQGAVWNQSKANSALIDARKKIEGLDTLIKIEFNDKPLILINKMEVL